MSSFTNYAENKVLNHIFNGAANAYTPPTTVYVALFKADPTESGSLANEVSGGSYARRSVTFGAAASRQITQSATITFPQATANWGTITHYGLMDAATSGNMIAYGQLNPSKQVVTGNTLSIPSGQIVLSFPANNGASTYLANKILDFVFRNQTFTQPSTYIALTTADPGDSSTGSTITEPSGNGYARKQVNPSGGSSPTWAVATTGLITNTHTITFATPSGSWGTITGACVVDAASAGNVLFYEIDITEQAVGANDTVEFPVGDFDIYLD